MEYELVSNQCLNSKWCASFLAGGEKCECAFECKVRVKHISSGYVYIVSESEFAKLVINGKIASQQSVNLT